MAVQDVPEEISADVPKDGFNFTLNPLTLKPDKLLEDIKSMRCTKVFLEFLKPGIGGMNPRETIRVTNHAILKFDFANSYGTYKGVQVSMEVEPAFTPTLYKNTKNIWLQPGKLVVKPVTYTGGSTDSARTARTFNVVRVTSVKDSVGEITKALCEENLHKFVFVNAFHKSDKVSYGSRDYMYVS